MKNRRIALWRRKISMVSTSLSLLFFAVACFVCITYASNPSNLHVQEGFQHAQTLALFWHFSVYSCMLLSVLSLFGFGWSRWIGLVLNCSAFLYVLMTLGATCGPFGC
jgi:hypothetical protein